MKSRLLKIKRNIMENKKRAVAWLLAVSLVAGISPLTVFADAEYKGESMLEDKIGDLNPVPYNNEGLIVDTGFGTFGSVAVADMNQDGYLDLLASSTYAPNPCSVIYYGSADSQNSKSNNYLLMTEPLVVSNTKAQPNGTCIYEYDEKTHLYGNYQYTLINNFGTAMGNATAWPGASAGYGYGLPAGAFDDYKEAHQNVLKTAGETSTFENKSGSGHYYADYDGDGLLDMIWAISCADDNGWTYGLLDSYYDEEGKWDKNDDGKVDYENGWVFWYKNTGTADQHQYDYSKPQVVVVYDWKYDANGKKQIIEDTKEPLDVKGTHHAQMKDWDNDGDLDIIWTSFVNEVRYFENIGTSTNPIYLKGREIITDKGNVWENLYAMTFATSADWNKDGYMDWIGTSEQGSIYLVENTGKKTEDNTPIFKEPQYFRQPATNIKIDSESPIYSIDWDGDGDEDILTGDAHGYLSFIKNVTIEKGGDLSNPIWEERVLFTNPDGEVYRIIPGENGSIQGPQEYNYGYTCISVADWDDDGTLDVMSNNAWGKVLWHRGIEGKPYQLEDARPVEVEWEGEAKYPVGNWWKPEGNELVTLWRTNPFMIDLNNDDLMDLVMMDTEGRLAYYERYQSADGTLKLKEGKNIFKNASGNVFRLREISNFAENGSGYGTDGRIKFTLADWNKDGKLDLLYEESPNVQAGEPGNVAYAENVAAKPGEYMFKFPGQTLHTRSLADHSMSPTTCNWNGDDYPDLLVSAADGRIYYMINPLTAEETSEKTRIVCVGDSITQGVGTENEATDSYPAQLQEILGDEYEVLNAGNSGKGALKNLTDNRYYGNGQIYKTSLAFNPNIVLMMLGTNDACDLFAKNYSDTGWNDDVKSAFKEDYVELLESYQKLATKPKIFIVLPTYCYEVDSYVDGGGNTITLNRQKNLENYVIPALKEIANEYQIETIDMQSFTKNHADWFPDTVHPNKVAYGYIANEFARKIRTDLGDLSSSLVAHWDFEGANPFADKATAGESTDNLTEVTGSAGTGAVVIENGVATLTGAKALKAEDAADLDQTGKMTLFARVKMDDSDIGSVADTAIIDKRRTDNNAVKVYGLLAAKNGTSYNLNFNMRMKENVNIEVWKDMPNVLNKAQWREVAAVVDHNENGYLTYKVYISKSEVATSGDDYTLLCEGTVDGYTEHAENNYPLYIGNWFDVRNSNSKRMFDDVRIYNTALNTEQLAGLIEEGPEHSLVAHWDFEGANPLADKATAGESTDNLTEVTGSAGTGAVVIENGIATLTGAKALKAADAADLDQTGKMTLFARIKMDDSDIGTEASTGIIDKRRNFNNGEKVYGLLAEKSGKSYHLNFNMRMKENVNIEVWKDMPNVLDKAQWREIAAVVDHNENGYLTYKVYISKSEVATSGDDYTLLCEGTVDGYTEHAENDLPLYLGNRFELKDSNSTRMLDDVRIYSTALNTEQLAGLIVDQPKNTLVAHWDFNGDNPLADKAEGGISDDLEKVNSDYVTVENGLATITSTGALKATDSTDLGITGPMTMFARVKVSGMGASGRPADTSIIHKNGAYKLVTWYVGEQSDLYAKGKHALAFGMNVPGKIVDYNFGRIPNEAWREVAIVVDKNDDGYLTYEMFVSKNEATADGDDFLSLYKSTTIYTEHITSRDDLYIGNNPSIIDSVSERIFDDVRIYNQALSTQELAEIISPTEDLTANNDTTSYYLSSLGDNQYISFGANKTTYDVTTEDVTLVLAPEAKDDIVIKVNGTQVQNGVANDYALQDGANQYVITLHNQSGTLKNRYTINITANLMTVAKLQAEIDEAKAIEQGSYTDTSYAYLQAAIDKAEEVAGTEGVTDAQLRLASKTLKEAILDLTTEMRIADLTALVADVTRLGLQNTGYKYWDEYQTQLTKAEDLISSSAPYTAEIEATYTALDEAYDKLFTEDDLPVSLEGFRHATLSSFGMTDKDYTGDTEWSFQSVNDSSTTETFDRTLLSMWVDFEFDNAFNGSYKGYITIMNGSTSSIRIFPEGTGAAIGLNPMNCSGLNYERLDLTKAGISANDEKFLLQIGVEYKDTDSNGVDDQIHLRYYANGMLLLEQTGTCDTSLFGNKLFVCGNQGNVIKLASVVPENKDLTNVTTSDFENPGSQEKAVDQTFESGSDVHAYKLNQSNISNMASTKFQTKITFNGSGYQNGIRYAGTNAEYGIFMYVDGTGDLAVDYNEALSPNIGKTFYIKPEKAGLETFKGTKFILGITTEYADYDGDGDVNDVQMGFYINGKLYNNQYLYSYDCKDTFGNWLSIYSNTATTAIASVPELIYHNLDQAATYTLETGAGWINGKAVEANALTKSGDYEIAFGSMDNIATYAVLYRPGDAHVDDQSDVRDLVATLKASEGITLTSKAAMKAANANGDSTIDESDIIAVYNKLLR